MEVCTVNNGTYQLSQSCPPPRPPLIPTPLADMKQVPCVSSTSATVHVSSVHACMPVDIHTQDLSFYLHFTSYA